MPIECILFIKKMNQILHIFPMEPIWITKAKYTKYPLNHIIIAKEANSFHLPENLMQHISIIPFIFAAHNNE